MLSLRGTVSASKAHIASDEIDSLNVGDLLAGGDRFALKVEGDSLAASHIADGDVVVIQQQNDATDGQIVAVQTENGEVSLKYYHPEQGRVRLEALPSGGKSTT